MAVETYSEDNVNIHVKLGVIETKVDDLKGIIGGLSCKSHSIGITKLEERSKTLWRIVTIVIPAIAVMLTAMGLVLAFSRHSGG